MTATKSTRFNHSNCKHATSGAEGKKARAACRKEHIAKAAKEAAKATKKPVARRTPRAAKVVETPAPAPAEA